MTRNENIDDVLRLDAGACCLKSYDVVEITYKRVACLPPGIAPFRDDVVTESDCAEKVAGKKSGYYSKMLQD
ncbi:hypothetical protein PI125_g11355 [Phytophthora idaei]|nr:hypothetical protein PI125_g11355 [Phytophthora idaei]